MSRKKQHPPTEVATPSTFSPIRDGQEITFLSTGSFPSSATQMKASTERDLRTLKPMFRDQRFFKNVEAIRARFKIFSGGGRRNALGVTKPGEKPPTPEQEKRNLEEFENDMALAHDTAALRSFRIRRRSCKRQFDRAITQLLAKWRLPERFRQNLSAYVRYYAPDGLWPMYGPHAAKLFIRLKNEAGLIRMFVEIFGDTKEKHYRAAWKLVEELREEHHLPGSQLFRHKNYYLEETIAAGAKQVHPVTGEKDFYDEMPYHEKNLLKWRQQRRNSAKSTS